MSEWYEKYYFNAIDWVLDEYEHLALTHEEGLIVLLILFLNKHHQTIDYQILSNKLKMDINEIDAGLSSLHAKGYLDILPKSNGIDFDLSGMFKNEKKALNFESSLFELFESEFKRPLTQREMQMLSDWMQEYENKMIGYALREASINSKCNFNYINKILLNWKQKNYTVEDYEDGKYCEV